MRIQHLGLAAAMAALLTSACATTATQRTLVPVNPESVVAVSASAMLDPARAPMYTRDAILANPASAPEIAAAAVESAPNQGATILRAALEAAPEQGKAIRAAVSRVEWQTPIRVSQRVPEWSELQRIVDRATH